MHRIASATGRVAIFGCVTLLDTFSRFLELYTSSLTNSTVCSEILTWRVKYPAFSQPNAKDCDSELDHCAGYEYAESDNLNPIIFSISEKDILSSSIPHFFKYIVKAINLSPLGIFYPS